jgi:hypothetical protein
MRLRKRYKALTPQQRAEITAILSIRCGRRPRWSATYVAALYGVTRARISQLGADIPARYMARGNAPDMRRKEAA